MLNDNRITYRFCHTTCEYRSEAYGMGMPTIFCKKDNSMHKSTIEDGIIFILHCPIYKELINEMQETVNKQHEILENKPQCR